MSLGEIEEKLNVIMTAPGRESSIVDLVAATLALTPTWSYSSYCRLRLQFLQLPALLRRDVEVSAVGVVAEQSFVSQWGHGSERRMFCMTCFTESA